MDKVKEYLENWLNELNNFSYKTFDKHPDMGLYMDQVITYLDRELAIFQNSSLDKQITSSMINNYVKGDVLPAPIKKRYTREHLAIIEEICTLKQVLSIAEVKQIIDKEYSNESKAKVFNDFNAINNTKIEEAVGAAFKEFNNIDEGDTSALTNLALKFATTANAYNSIAKKILYMCRLYDESNEINNELNNEKATDLE